MLGRHLSAEVWTPFRVDGIGEVFQVAANALHIQGPDPEAAFAADPFARERVKPPRRTSGGWSTIVLIVFLKLQDLALRLGR